MHIDISSIEQDRRITVLEENSKRLDRDLREVKQEMNDGFKTIAGKQDALNGKIDGLIIQIAQSKAQVQGGWFLAVKSFALIGFLLTFIATVAALVIR